MSRELEPADACIDQIVYLHRRMFPLCFGGSIKSEFRPRANVIDSSSGSSANSMQALGCAQYPQNVFNISVEQSPELFSEEGVSYTVGSFLRGVLCHKGKRNLKNSRKVKYRYKITN